ncbi:MAG TPA: hypothetical protein VEG33_02105 [Streptosporangiaceae bacterium]|nr:hypothetical protein [Streptosporangiaceae bacterium]
MVTLPGGTFAVNAHTSGGGHGYGHDMDHYADDLAAVTAHLDLHDAVHIGHSTPGGLGLAGSGPARNERVCRY